VTEELDKAAKLRKVTAILLAAFTLILVMWDVKVAYNDVKGDTISELLRDVSHAWYILPYLMGVVMGHLFWNRAADNMNEPKKHLLIFFGVIGGSSALVLLRDAVNFFVNLPGLNHANLVLVVVGFFMGAAFWPQTFPTKKEETDR